MTGVRELECGNSRAAISNPEMAGHLKSHDSEFLTSSLLPEFFIRLQKNTSRIVNTKFASDDGLEGGTSWLRGLGITCESLVLTFMLYAASTGPVYRMYFHREISARSLAFYRPLMSTRSPFYLLSRNYVLMWM